jgi:hypothetical protein
MKSEWRRPTGDIYWGDRIGLVDDAAGQILRLQHKLWHLPAFAELPVTDADAPVVALSVMIGEDRVMVDLMIKMRTHC